jgi:hypothetical protein
MSIATPGLTIIDLYEKRVLKNGCFGEFGGPDGTGTFHETR